MKDGTGGIGSSGNGYYLEVNTGAGTVSVEKVTAGISETVLTASTTINVGDSHYFQATRSSTNVWRIFKNNILISSTATDSTHTVFTTLVNEYQQTNSGGIDNIDITDTNDLIGSATTAFSIIDEETLNPLPSATLTINGTAWPVGSLDANFDVNSSITFPATIIASASGYSERTFNFDTNNGLQEIKKLV